MGKIYGDIYVWERKEENGMSMYGESEYNSQKNNIYDEIKWFLEEHPISELLQIVADVVEREVEDEE